MSLSAGQPISAAPNVPEFQFQSLRHVCRQDWLTICTGMMASFLLASIYMSGWPQGLIPEIKVPYAYSGDALSSTWLIQRAMEGWIFHNDRSGFPFGSSFLDYPGSDSASFLILKILGLLTGSSAGALNLYFLLSFPVNFLAAYLVLRSLRVGKALGFAAAVLFAFAPFHFLRLVHLFYTWYFVAPIYFYIGLQIALNGKQFDFKHASWRRRALLAALYLILSSFGVYYTAFGMLVIGAASLVALFNRNLKTVRFVAAPVIFFLAIGTAANLAPNVFNEHRLGHNPEVAARSPVEAEVYGLKPMQLVLPRPGHRSPFLAGITSRYNDNTPLVNENYTASLGMIGVGGLFILVLAAFMGMAGVQVDRRLSNLAVMSLVLLAFMVIGGLGSLFAHLISPSIRGWNRASIFLSFSTLAAVALVAQAFSERFSKRVTVQVASAFALFMVSVGLWDQTLPPCKACLDAVRQPYEQDRAFIEQIEHDLPAGAALYQLPYMGFPESSPINKLNSYGLTTGFIHSRNLKWSFAGMRGREGDLYFRTLASMPVSDQLRAIQDKGFAAVYIDTDGYADGGTEIIQAWTDVLGHGPDLKRADGKVVMFNLAGSPRPDATKIPADSAARQLDSTPLPASRLAPFLGTGWSSLEPWGVWSEGAASTLIISAPPAGASHLRIHFNGFVPSDRTLVITAGIDGAEPVQTIVRPDRTVGLMMDVALPAQNSSSALSVSLSYDKPISPQQAGVSSDKRMIALGLTSLQWVGP
ncbi:sugar translocase [Stenotrophomonas rhizophila]|uniref:sugar translocase n=1 Tax=Stenotrophomonas rhizophila TaxID=216778 RepID=UPI0028A9763D|nr:sugar translocase [Stenotrophomonas rhizophila]